MLAHILRLESLKQRHLALSTTVILAAALFITMLRQLVARQGIQEGLAGMFVLLAIGGIPLLAVLLGGSAGAALRTTSGKMIEEALPFHPRSAFFSAYLISLLHFGCIAVLVITGTVLTGAAMGIEAVTDLRWNDPALILTMLQLHALSFALSYLSKLTIVGAASALVICGLQLSLFLMPGPQYVPYWFEDGSGTTAFYFVAATTPFLFSAIIAFLTKHLQRDGRPGIITRLLLPFLLFAGSFALYGNSIYKEKRFETELNPVWVASHIFNPEKEKFLKRGAIFSTASGNIVRLAPDGQKMRLGKAEYTYGKITYGSENSVWVLTSETEHTYAIRYERNGALQDYSIFTSTDVEPTYIVLRDNLVYVFGNKLNKGQVYAVLTGQNEKPVWKKNTWQTHFLERSFDPVVESGEVAYPSADRKQLLQKLPNGSVRQWTLPGVAVEDMMPIRSNLHATAFETKEGAAFFLVVRDSELKQRIVVCRPEGTVTEPWPNDRLDEFVKIRIHHIPGGGVAAVPQPATVLYVLDSEGNAFKPVEVPLLSDSQDNFVQTKKFQGNDLWIMINGMSLIRFDLQDGSHTVLKQLHQKASPSWNPTEEGIYLTHSGKIRLLDWDGRERIVTSAKME